MRNKSVYLMVVLLAACVISAEAASLEQRKLIGAAKDRVTKIVTERYAKKVKAPTCEIVQALEAFRAHDPDATNAEVQAYVNTAVLNVCQRDSIRFGKRYGEFQAEFAAKTVEAYATRILGDSQSSKCACVEVLNAYIVILCNAERYVDAETRAKAVVAMPSQDGDVNAQALQALMRVYRWWDKYDLALATGREMCKIKPNYIDSVVLMTADFDRADDGLALWKEFSTELSEFSFYATHRGRPVYGSVREKVRPRLRAFIRDGKIPVEKRFRLASELGLFGNDTLESAEDRAVFKGEDLSQKKFTLGDVSYVANAYIYGQWALFTRLMDDFGAVAKPDLKVPRYQRAYAMALAYQGREKEALAALNAAKSVKDLKPLDQAKYAALEAVLLKKDPLPAIDAFKLPAKERAEAYLMPAQFTLNLKRNDESQRYAAAYEACFKELPRRTVEVPFFERPVSDITAWRAIRRELKPTLVDAKVTGDLEFLETDVATGRTSVEKTALDSDDIRMEITQLCDIDGLHIFLSVKDKNARQVEDGFAGGIGTEMYFAPGENQPYICFGTSPRTGIDFEFNTAYSSMDHARLQAQDAPKGPRTILNEVAFSDEDYVCHLCFPWTAFYQKLPAKPGTVWKFNCMADGYAWCAVRTVHEPSRWGDLVFNLTPAQVTAIRRRLVMRTYKTWNKGASGQCAPFDRWADPVIGDPDFYATCLKSLEAELTGYAARVKPEMTDADVNEIFVKGAQRWMGLKYEIDLLRRKYLTDKYGK